MTLELYLTFVLATAVLIILPGPNVTLIVAHAIAHGARTAFATVMGTQCAQAVQLALVALGMATLIVSFAEVFEWLRWLGVGYLIWLGISRWRGAGAMADSGSPAGAVPKGLFWQGCAWQIILRYLHGGCQASAVGKAGLREMQHWLEGLPQGVRTGQVPV